MFLTALIACVFIASVLAVGLVRRVALARHWVAKPRADRWHEKPTALHGGVGFFVPFFAGAGILFWHLTKQEPGLYGAVATQKLMLGYLGGMLIMFVTGLLDDIYQFRPSSKLLLEVLATVVFMAAGGVGSMTGSEFFDTALTFLWFIGIVNAVNMLDNMDGASSGVVLIGSLGVVLIGYLHGADSVPLSFYLGLLLVVAIFGFWLYNRPPASIFMGDSGSLFMGFAFAGITLPGPLNLGYGLEGDTVDPLHAMLIAATLAAIPILDTSLVTVTRLWRGQSPAVGGKDHSTHRLAQSGLGPYRTIFVLYALAALCVVFALGMQRSPQLALLLFSILVGGFGLTAFYLAAVAVETGQKRRHAWQQLLDSLLYRAPLIKGIVDIPLIMVAFYAAYMVRFDFHVPDEHLRPMYVGMLAAVVCCLFANLLLGVYRFSWRSASSTDVVHYVGCGLLGTILTLATVTVLSRFEGGHSRGAFVAFSVIYICGLVAVRFGFRFLDEVVAKLRHVRSTQARLTVVILGAGREGVMLRSRAQDLPEYRDYAVLAFVDYDRSLQGTMTAGLPVLAPDDTKGLQQLPWSFEGAEIWVASERITDAEALAVREQIERPVTVRRLRLSFELLGQ